MPEHRGANAGQKRGANLGLYLWALQYGRGTSHLNAWTERTDDIDINTGHRAHQRFGLQIKVIELALQAVDPLAQRVERAFGGGEFTLEYHQTQRVAGQFRVQPLTAAGIQHAEQGFQTEAQIRLAAAEHAQR